MVFFYVSVNVDGCISPLNSLKSVHMNFLLPFEISIYKPNTWKDVE